MKTIFEYTNVSASTRLESFTIKKLEKIFKQYPFVIRSDIFFRKENKSDQKGHICGIQLSAPGPRIYASSDEKTFEGAISNTIDDLIDQLQKRKMKLYKSSQIKAFNKD
ncbi:HPF/RaiA family ribosome-associated protein [Aquimarina gracilis]|uniref:HPF/RaiA family ribosome-associated protein n=1 Tax=Aquimarina gracilis TaxID=874422 RepID=A0ABU5ZUN1_9FLAO|nr:HPF/RaiA family ribosome-associated protein [Aquimarina gracilis]MEB3345792.1 HPF/RaiA family ribosome-associated protein [Aquimarina gracilis]